MNDSTEIYNNAGDIKNDDDPFFVTPNVHGHIYTASCVFMAFVACFGIPANASIFVLFFNSPLVSYYQEIFIVDILRTVFEDRGALIVYLMEGKSPSQLSGNST